MKNKNTWFIVLLLIIIAVGLVLWFVASRNSDVVPLPRITPSDTNQDTIMTNETPFRLTSPSFAHNGEIPEQFTCDGDNVNPPLSISGTPEEAKSLVLIVEDPDIPEEVKESMGISVFDHWVLFNISPDTKEINQNEAPGVEGLNSSEQTGYTGPCPPTQYQPTEHRYFFRAFALDSELDLSEGASRREVEEAMEGHVIAQTEIIGRYDRTK